MNILSGKWINDPDLATSLRKDLPIETVSLTGRILNIKRRHLPSGRVHAIGEILVEGKRVSFFFEGDQDYLRHRDYAVLIGAFHQNTFVATAINNHVATPKKTRWPEHIERGLNPRLMGLLHIRSKIDSLIHEQMRQRGMLPVSSPALVSGWVQGQTGSFDARFYEADCKLTISNLIYHQMLLGNGVSRIYELGKLFRQENPSTRKRLAEFTILDISLANASVKTIQDEFESLIIAMHEELQRLTSSNSELPQVPSELRFDQILYRELLARVGISEISGHQLPRAVARYLDENFHGFVWIAGFPEHTRPFYQRSTVDNHCLDVQLWYRGSIYVGAGGECETDPVILERKILAEGKEPTAFDFLLEAYKFGMPSSASMSLGIERLLATWLQEGTAAADFAFFPRYQSHFKP